MSHAARYVVRRAAESGLQCGLHLRTATDNGHAAVMAMVVIGHPLHVAPAGELLKRSGEVVTTARAAAGAEVA